MKFFTPARYLRLGNLDDREAFLAAQREWESAIAHYKQHLTRIGAELPTGLQRLVETVYLHDARVLDMWWGGKTRFTITVHPESDPSRLVVLAYSLVAPPEVTPGALPDAVRSEPAAWLYDELDVAGGSGPEGRMFSHDILLSDGREVRLRFRNVVVTRPVPFVPDLRVAPEAPMDASHSA
jgi:hypothetical protein